MRCLRFDPGNESAFSTSSSDDGADEEVSLHVRDDGICFAPLLEKGGVDRLSAEPNGLAAARNYLLSCPQWALMTVLRDVEMARPGLLSVAVSQVSQAKSTGTRTKPPHPIDILPDTTQRRLTKLAQVESEAPIVQFSCPIYYVGQHEDVMVIDVMRFEPLGQKSIVKYTTQDSTAVAGTNFKAASGELHFQPGQEHSSFEIHLIKTDVWNTSLEFKLELLAEDRENCQLGRYLYHTRVKIMDKQTFPSSRYAEQINSGRIDEVHRLKLLWEYIKMNWNKVRPGTLKFLALGQYVNVQYLLTMYSNVFLIDYILASDFPADALFLVKDKAAWLFLIIGVKLAFFLSMHILDYKSNAWGVGGQSRKALQTGMMRKYAIASTEVRSSLCSADLIMTMTRDVEKLVKDGYQHSIDLVEVFGKVFMVFLFQVTSPIVFNKKPRPMAYIPLVILPVLISIFVACRERKTREYLRERQRTEDEFVSYVDNSVDNFALIRDYNRRDRCADQFELAIKNMSAARRASNQINCNNEKAVEWLTFLLTALYYIYGGINVILGNVGVGVYLTNLKIFDDMGSAWLKVYTVVSDMIACGPALKQVTKLLTLPSDLQTRMELNRMRRQASVEHYHMLNQRSDNRHLLFDLEPIVVKDLLLQTESYEPHLKMVGNLKVHQGEFVTLLGPHSSGKASLLRVLGNDLLPDPQCMQHCGGHSVFESPSHLRVLHISPRPIFMAGSLLENLTFGCNPGDQDAGIDRVEAVCRHLNLSEHVMSFLREEGEASQQWISWVSTSERSLLNLARALITNPEVLCLHKPTNDLDEATSIQVMHILRAFVEQKGMEMDPLKWHLRRPRTCIITSSKVMSAAVADRCCVLSKTTGLHLLSPVQVRALIKAHIDDPNCLTEDNLLTVLSRNAR